MHTQLNGSLDLYGVMFSLNLFFLTLVLRLTKAVFSSVSLHRASTSITELFLFFINILTDTTFVSPC